MREEILWNWTGELVLCKEKRFDGAEFVELRNWTSEGIIDKAECSEAANLNDGININCTGEVEIREMEAGNYIVEADNANPCARTRGNIGDP